MSMLTKAITNSRMKCRERVPPAKMISHSQTPFCTEGRGLGNGQKAVCCLHRGVHTSHSAVHMLPEVCG